ncbi:MAG: hypothetical protein ACR2H4_18215 [Pyrinomonadaceae bacterium]
MQSFDTNDIDSRPDANLPLTVIIGRVEELPVGSRKTIELPNEREIVLYNIGGEFYATTTQRGLPARGPRHREFLPTQRRAIVRRNNLRSSDRMRLARLAI